MKLILKIDKKINKDNNFNKKISIIKEFIGFCIKELNLKKGLTVKLLSKDYSDKRITTGSYEIGKYITLARFEGRLLSDVLTTIAHELTHQMQDEQGKLNTNKPIPDIGGEIEDEANASAGRLRKSFTLKYKQYKKSIYSLNESYKSFTKTLNEFDDTEEENNEELNDRFYDNFIYFDNIELLIELNDIKEVYNSGDVSYYLITNINEVLPFCKDILILSNIKEQLNDNPLLKLYLVYSKKNRKFALFLQNYIYRFSQDKIKYVNLLSTTNSATLSNDENGECVYLDGFEIFDLKIKQFNTSKEKNILTNDEDELKNVFYKSIATLNYDELVGVILHMPFKTFTNILDSFIIKGNKEKMIFIGQTFIKYVEKDFEILEKLYDKLNIFIHHLLVGINYNSFIYISDFLSVIQEKNILSIENYNNDIMFNICRNIFDPNQQSSVITRFFTLNHSYINETLINILNNDLIENDKKINFLFSYLNAITRCHETKNNFNLYIDALINTIKTNQPLKTFLHDLYFNKLKNDNSRFKTYEMSILTKKLKRIFEPDDSSGSGSEGNPPNPPKPPKPPINENYIRQFVKQNIKKLLI